MTHELPGLVPADFWAAVKTVAAAVALVALALTVDRLRAAEAAEEDAGA